MVAFGETHTAKAAEGSQPISEWFGATKARRKKQYLDTSVSKAGQAPSPLKPGLLESKRVQKQLWVIV